MILFVNFRATETLAKNCDKFASNLLEDDSSISADFKL